MVQTLLVTYVLLTKFEIPTFLQVPIILNRLLLDCNDSEIKIITICNSWFYIFARYMKFFHDDYSSQIRWVVTVL